MIKNDLNEIIYSSNFKSRKFLQVSGSIKINTSTDKIWQTLTEPNHLLLFNSFIKEHSCDAVTANHSDSCVYYNNKVLIREIDTYVLKRKLKYKIWFEEEKKPSYSCFEIIDNQSNPPSFKLTLETNAYKNVPRPIWHTVAYLFIIPSLKKYISALLFGMKQYCETGQKVDGNQFGKHNKFS